MTIAWALATIVPAQVDVGSEATTNLLRLTLIVVLVVTCVILLAAVLRPIVPAGPPARTEAEQDEMTMRRLGLKGPAERSVADAAASPPAPIPFPSVARAPVHLEDERIYHDPVIAARLRHVLSSPRHERRRVATVVATVVEPLVARVGGPTSRPWLVQEDARGPVGHTRREPSRAAPGGTIDRDQEHQTMPTSDIEQSPGYLPDPAAGSWDANSAAVIEGVAPSSADLDRLADGPPQPRAKVVPFIPRQVIEQHLGEARVDASVVAALTATVRELLFCSNVGEYLHGFALYSDRYLFRFMDETGMSVDEFRAAFEGAPAREPEEWTRLSHLSEVRAFEDGVVVALVTYLDGERPGPQERYAFVLDADRAAWLIDGIEQV